MNKAQLADVSQILNLNFNEEKKNNKIFSLPQTIMKHFKTIQIKEKEVLTYFMYMVKSNSNKLDQKNGIGNDGS